MGMFPTAINYQNIVFLFSLDEISERSAFSQTWKLKEEGRLLEIVDPELTEYPEAEVMRFIKVALFCTQAAYQQRPSMKQVVEMLSKEVRLNEKILTEPGVYRLHNSQKSGFCSLSSHQKRGNQSVNQFATSAQFDSFQSATQMLPR